MPRRTPILGVSGPGAGITLSSNLTDRTLQWNDALKSLKLSNRKLLKMSGHRRVQFGTLVCFSLACSVLLLTGCGRSSDGPEVFKVSGTVALDGQPVEEGRILLRKKSGDGKAFSAPIKHGSYSVMSEAGPMSVEITASRIIPGKFDNSNGTPEPVGEMYIPRQYNAATTLEVIVPEGGKSNADFPLSS